MDKDKLKKAIDYAKQNPNSEFANELRRRIETGQIVIEQKEPSYLQRVGEQFSNIGERTTEALQKTGEGYAEKAGQGDILGATKELARGGLRTVGAVTEGAFVPIVEAPVIKQALDFIGEKIGNTEVGQKLAQKIQENPETAQDIMDIVNTLTLGVGKTVEKPLVTGVEKAITGSKKALETGIDTLKAKEATKLSSQVDELIGKITQGTGEDITMAKKALGDIDTKSIKTYKDLSDTLNSKIETLSAKLDERLAQSPIYDNKLKLGDVEKTIKVGDKTVSHNYVEDALNQLEDFYSKTNNIAERVRISDLRNKFETDGITIKEMNDLAKLHGRVLTGYNASGELASGLSKQAAENTRKGIKSTARDIFGDKAYQAIDEELSNILNTKSMVDTVATKVETLKNKITKRGFGEKVGRLVFQVADKFTGGGLKGFIQSFVPRGEGLKIMNALDLEKALNKNLKLLDKAMNSKTESATIKALEGILDYIENPKMGLSIEDVSKKGKGTIPENSQKITAYHGTNAKFEDFDIGKLMKNEKDRLSKAGFWFTDSKTTAKSYGKNVKETTLEFKKPKTIDADGQTYGDFRQQLEDAVEEAQKNGNDGLIIKNLSDRKDWGNYEPATHYIALDKNTIKSRISYPENSLIQEAKKYKSAEEFWNNNKNTSFNLGGDKYELNSIDNNGNVWMEEMSTGRIGNMGNMDDALNKLKNMDNLSINRNSISRAENELANRKLNEESIKIAEDISKQKRIEMDKIAEDLGAKTAIEKARVYKNLKKEIKIRLPSGEKFSGEAKDIIDEMIDKLGYRFYQKGDEYVELLKLNDYGINIKKTFGSNDIVKYAKAKSQLEQIWKKANKN